MKFPHDTVPVQVWVDIDVDIAAVVHYLNTIPGVRTDASCQGTIGGDGPKPYVAYVMAHWTREALVRLKREFSVERLGNGTWGYLRPKNCADTFKSDPTAPWMRGRCMEEEIRRTGLPRDVFGLIHDLCYHHNVDQSYVNRARRILMNEDCPE